MPCEVDILVESNATEDRVGNPFGVIVDADVITWREVDKAPEESVCNGRELCGVIGEGRCFEPMGLGGV